MKFDNSGKHIKTLVVLGAGASRGASFVKKGALGIYPPLDKDYFSELRLLKNKDTKNLLEFVRKEFGINPVSKEGLSMEEFFSLVEEAARYHDSDKKHKKADGYRAALDSFYQSLPKFFRKAFHEEKCDYHNKLVKCLSVDDVIISFNYDCLIDSALRDQNGKKWFPEGDGYGVYKPSGSEHWREGAKMANVSRLFKENGVGRSLKLLKLHGSLNWKIKKNGEVELQNEPYTLLSAKDSIIPPTWSKSFDQPPYKLVRKCARGEIPNCRAIIVIGYSVHPTDLSSRTLFKSEIDAESLDFLVIVNPDKSAHRKFIDLVKNGIKQTVVIREFNDLEDLSKYLPFPSRVGLH